MKKTYLFGPLAAGLLFTACQSDDLLGPDGSVSQVDKTLYVNMNIRGDIASGTRAASSNGTPVDTDDFDNGTTAESRVSNAYFVFYDNAGNLVGEVTKVQLPAATTATAPDGTVEKYYQSVVPVSVYKGEADPTQVVCYINPITPASLQNNLNVIQTNTRDILYSGEGDNRLFAMSNSVYYPTETGDGAPQIAVPITSTQLFTTEDDAKAALTAEGTPNVVDIYVERYAAKLKFNKVDATPYVTATSPINDPTEIPVTLSFVAKRWALNAACQESYIVKSFRQEAPNGGLLANNYGYSSLNTRINALSFSLNETGEPTYNGTLTAGNSWDWNNPEYHRSYWGMSPAYFTNEYPEVSSDVTGLQNALSQKYYSYNELTAGTNPAGYAATDNNPHYFHETTVGAKALLSKNPAAATPSVILVGDYTVSVNGTACPAGTTFYTYLNGSAGKPLVYFESTGAQGNSAIPGAESMLRRLIEQTSILFKKVGDEYVQFDITSQTDMATLVGMLEVTEPSAEVKGDLKIAERYRTLQFNGNPTTGVYVATTDGYMAISDATDTDNNQISLADANKALMQQVGFCNKYESGSAYFNIPVKHYGWYRGGNDQKTATKIDWNKVRVGDFGVVRNHSYSVDVTAITGLGTGIGGHDSPIVPPADTKDYFVAYRVNVLKWAVLPVQEVAL